MKHIIGLIVVANVALAVCSACKAPLAPIVDAAACIAEQAASGSSLVDIAKACGVAVEEAIASLLQSADPRVQKSMAAAEARRARLAFVQSTLCEGTVIPFDAGAIWAPEGGGK